MRAAGVGVSRLVPLPIRPSAGSNGVYPPMVRLIVGDRVFTGRLAYQSNAQVAIPNVQAFIRKAPLNVKGSLEGGSYFFTMPFRDPDLIIDEATHECTKVLCYSERETKVAQAMKDLGLLEEVSSGSDATGLRTRFSGGRCRLWADNLVCARLKVDAVPGRVTATMCSCRERVHSGGCLHVEFARWLLGDGAVQAVRMEAAAERNPRNAATEGVRQPEEASRGCREFFTFSTCSSLR